MVCTGDLPDVDHRARVGEQGVDGARAGPDGDADEHGGREDFVYVCAVALALDGDAVQRRKSLLTVVTCYLDYENVSFSTGCKNSKTVPMYLLLCIPVRSCVEEARRFHRAARKPAARKSRRSS